MLVNQEKSNFYKSVSETLKILNSRSQDVVSRRFGLKAGTIETLESIGAKYGITRERVRQIEEASLRELRKNFDNFGLGEYVSTVKNILGDQGNVIREDLLFKGFSGSPEYDKTNAALVFLLTISSGFENYPENDKFYSLWTFKDPAYINQAQGTVEKLIQEFKKVNSPVPEAQLEVFFNKALNDPLGQQSEAKESKAVFSFLNISRLIGKNIFNQWGLINWPEISPKGVRDKAHLVLKRAGKSLHFREIAELINRHNFDSKKANFQTVHNELIKDKRFVLVGRGLYALTQWGYEPGTVKEVLAGLLKKYGPMPKDKLIAKTAEVRFVKPNTILLNLQDKKLFKKDKNGLYCLIREA